MAFCAGLVLWTMFALSAEHVRPREGPPFILEATILSVTCPGCGRALALYDKERDDALKEAIMAALNTAGINRK